MSNLTLYEAKKNLELSLGEELRVKYFAILNRWFLFKGAMTKMQLDSAIRNLLVNKEQAKNHNLFILALLQRVNQTKFKEMEELPSTSDESSFQMVEHPLPLSPATHPPPDVENRSAAAELFMPDSGFISMRITLAAWENGLHGAEENVTDIMVQACQIFVKNIITAMISRKKGYKIKDGKFQHGFSMPVPDPLIRNTHNIFDSNIESKVENCEDDDCFIPSRPITLENAQQRAAFAYSCATKIPNDNTLTVKLLYDTLRDNPKLLGLHSMHSINLLKLGLHAEEPL